MTDFNILQYEGRLQNESLPRFALRFSVLSMLLFRHFWKEEQRNLSGPFFYIAHSAATLQVFCYVSWAPSSQTLLGFLYRIAWNAITAINFELNFYGSNFAVAVFFYGLFFLLYLANLVIAMTQAAEILRMPLYRNYVAENAGKLLAFRLYVITSKIFYCSFMGIFLVGFCGLLSTTNLPLRASFLPQQAYRPAMLAFYSVLAFFYTFEFSVELFVNIKDYGNRLAASRVSSVGHFAFQFTKIAIILFSSLSSDPQRNPVFSGLTFLALPLICVYTFFDRPYFRLTAFKVFFQVECFVVVAALYGFVMVITSLRHFLVFELFTHLVVALIIPTLIEIHFYWRLRTLSDQLEKAQNSHISGFKNWYSLFHHLSFLFSNRRLFAIKSNILALLLERHQDHCTDVECMCHAQTYFEDDRELIVPLLAIYPTSFAPHFEKHCSDFKMISLKGNVLAEITHRPILSAMFYFAAQKRAHFFVEMVSLDVGVLLIDAQFKRQDWDLMQKQQLSSLALKRSYQMVEGLRHLLLRVAADFRDLEAEVLSRNSAKTPGVVTKLLKTFVNSLLAVEDQFALNCMLLKLNCQNRFMFWSFTVNVLGEKERSAKTVRSMDKLKKRIAIQRAKAETFQDLFRENSMSTLFYVSGNREDLMEIKEVFFNFYAMFGCEREELVGHQVTIIIPDMISRVHGELIDGFLDRGMTTRMNQFMWMPCRRKDGFIRVGRSLLLLHPGVVDGISFIAILSYDMTPIHKRLLRSVASRNEHVGFLLVDHMERIQGLTPEFQKISGLSKRFLESFNHKIQLEELTLAYIFPELAKSAEKRAIFGQGQVVSLSLSEACTEVPPIATIVQSPANPIPLEQPVLPVPFVPQELLVLQAARKDCHDGLLTFGIIAFCQRNDLVVSVFDISTYKFGNNGDQMVEDLKEEKQPKSEDFFQSQRRSQDLNSDDISRNDSTEPSVAFECPATIKKLKTAFHFRFFTSFAIQIKILVLFLILFTFVLLSVNVTNGGRNMAECFTTFLKMAIDFSRFWQLSNSLASAMTIFKSEFSRDFLKLPPTDPLYAQTFVDTFTALHPLTKNLFLNSYLYDQASLDLSCINEILDPLTHNLSWFRSTNDTIPYVPETRTLAFVTNQMQAITGFYIPLTIRDLKESLSAGTFTAGDLSRVIGDFLTVIQNQVSVINLNMPAFNKAQFQLASLWIGHFLTFAIGSFCMILITQLLLIGGILYLMSGPNKPRK